MSTRIEDLTPATQAKARAALADLDARGIAYAVTYTLRSYAEQAALYAQGRESLASVNAKRAAAGLTPIVPYTGKDGKVHSDNDYTVTNADGIRIIDGGKGRSPHQLGTALDVVPLMEGSPSWPPASDTRWAEIARSFEAQGFEWGGRWTLAKDGIAPDMPHYQLKA
jgi:hypothetical protein